MNNFLGIFDNNIRFNEGFTNPEINLSEKESVFVSKDIQVIKEENTTVYFSGEIYNMEGKNEEKGSRILRNYLHQGIESFKNYDGEFTLIIKKPNETIIFRDRHGAGPQVFYSQQYFTSFLKNFLTTKGFQPEPNNEALFTFLSIGYIPSPMCSLKGISKIPGGHVLKVKNGEQKLESLFTWEDFKSSCSNPRNISVEDATTEYEQLHKKSILNRVKGKKTVGLLLSGGYDSGGNIAGLREVYNGDALSYSIGFKDNPWTELPLAKILSERFGTTHYEYEIDGTEIRELPDIVDYLGDPFQEGGLMLNYVAMKLIGDNKPEVILGGDGNDQHFGTAGKELALHYSYKQKGFQPFQKLFQSAGKMGLFDNDNILFRMQFHNEKILNIQKSDNFGFKQLELQKLVKDRSAIAPHKYLESVPKQFANFDDFYFVHNYFGDIKQVINEVILFKASKMSSMLGNSLTFPYMSTEIYEFLKQMPRGHKCKGTLEEISKGKGTTKFLHKNYLKPKLPTEITNRKKQGGFAPLPIFFKDDSQRKKLSDFILASDAVKALFSEKYLHEFFKSYNETAVPDGYWFWYKQVKAFQFFNLLVLVIWWEIFINKKDASELKKII
jgi:asparagine synthase (glutamine-hydrolysing)